MTHCDILAGLSNLNPVDVQLKYRFICFLKKCLDHDIPMSCVANNYRQILRKYQNVLITLHVCMIICVACVMTIWTSFNHSFKGYD